MKLTGAQILIKCLEMEGVEHIFGLPGGVILPTYDVLYDSKIKLILTKHEQARRTWRTVTRARRGGPAFAS